MQEIAPRVYIETSFVGPTLGAINRPHGLILIDAPFRPEDQRLWRASLLNISGGVDRMLINLDGHYDRTIGARSMECTIVGQEELVQVFRDRPSSYKSQTSETGAEWEQYNGLGAVRWAPPEITFTNHMEIYWDDERNIPSESIATKKQNYEPMRLEERKGPSIGAIWVFLPEEKVVFLGDAVVVNHPPFFAGANIPLWIASLQLLFQPQYHDWFIVGGRDGLITHDQVEAHVQVLQKVQQRLEKLANQNAPVEAVEQIIPELLTYYKTDVSRKQQFHQRLRGGLMLYYSRYFNIRFSQSAE